MSVHSIALEREDSHLKTALSAGNVIQSLLQFDEVPIDRASIPQWRLDLVNRTRTSLFPWRGQFSPELIELLLATYADPETTLLDPFVGSGTTLFEAARQGIASFGAEINPAAIVMASAVHFVNVNVDTRNEYVERFHRLLESKWPIEVLQPVATPEEFAERSLVNRLKSLLTEADGDHYLANLISNLIVRCSDRLMSDTPIGATEIWRHARSLEQIITNLPLSAGECMVLHADARSLPLPSRSVDLVITSPPYINVFNYHQNYRAASELMGWNMLGVAKSEFGSNRKNRGNRFLTVVQYAIDMLSSLRELRRLTKPGGRVIVVVGRESNVRGVRFENARIVSALATGGAGFRLEVRQERKFKSKFGQTIFEDILHLVPTRLDLPATEDFGREVGEAVLAASLANVEPDVATSIWAALTNAPDVRPSPLFSGKTQGEPSRGGH